MDEHAELDILTPPLPSKKLQWMNYLGCVEALSAELADNGGKFEDALRTIKLSDYCYNARLLTGKQKVELRRAAKREAIQLQLLRQSAQVGDIVRVPRMVMGPLGYHRDGSRFVEAEIISRVVVANVPTYKVRRLEDDVVQSGNGHMIKSIVRRVSS
ncbi:hypothetical protein KQR54_18875 [Mycobacterium gordonae]|nr:hypothetical protein [Mycobacterium gordonae]